MKGNSTLYKLASTIFGIVVVYGFISSKQFELWLNILFGLALIFFLVATWKQ